MGEFDERREEVSSYLERLEQWMLANVIGEPTPAGTADRRVSVLLAVIGPKAYALLRNLLTPAKPSDQPSDQIYKTKSMPRHNDYIYDYVY